MPTKRELEEEVEALKRKLKAVFDIVEDALENDSDDDDEDDEDQDGDDDDEFLDEED